MNELDMLKAELAKVQAENEALKNPARKERSLSCKVSVKGALSVYGLGRFPVTLFIGQWAKLIAFMPELIKFADQHTSEFSTKDGQVVTIVGQDKAQAIITQGEEAA